MSRIPSPVASALFALALAWGATARAHESDPLTGRGSHMDDADPIADAAVDALLTEAAAATNLRLSCQASTFRTRKVLAREIDRRTSRNQLVPDLGPLRMFGHSRYSAILETARVDRLDFPEREDLFGPFPVRRSVILALVGPASTVQISGVRLSTDKLNHFFAQGYDYAQRSHWGRSEPRALRWGTFTERTWFGLITSNAFSFADLRANRDGMRFYLDLLKAGSVLERAEDGCVVQARAFHWNEHVTWEYDEALNPPVYTRPVQRGLDAVIAARREDICLAVARDPSLADPWLDMPDYVAGRVPVRTDPFRLATLCGLLERDVVADAYQP